MENETAVHPQVRAWLEGSVLQPYISEFCLHLQRNRYHASTMSAGRMFFPACYRTIEKRDFDLIFTLLQCCLDGWRNPRGFSSIPLRSGKSGKSVLALKQAWRPSWRCSRIPALTRESSLRCRLEGVISR